MSNSKIEIKVGIVKFSGEGEQKWLSEQLDKILEKIPELLKLELRVPSNPADPIVTSKSTPKAPKKAGSVSKQSLSTFLKEKKPTSKPDLFLATAIWIHDNQDKTRIQQKDINVELKKSSQVPILNLTQEFNRNVKKGYCVKDANSFYVTPEGQSQF